MAHETFWNIINTSLADNQDQQSKRLATELKKLSQEELVAFESAYRAKLRQAYHWDLWAAAYIINGGCSDDGFDYFCDWLISRGQAVYESALENPETLIDIATPWPAPSGGTEYEDFRYIMMNVMDEKHGAEFSKSSTPWPKSPAGEEWDEDTVNAKYPALAEWVENSVALAPPPSPQTPPQKLSFWQRLFGKR